MDNDMRRDPDAILRQISEAEASMHSGRGTLKIFFGYAAGVGKTYAMLEEAHTALAKGYDVVVGYVEPHAREDTLALLDGLEQLPPLELEHNGIVLHEFDLDAALERRPQVILVDELAHTNVPGSRHKKRYQDVEELLRAGINVFTTVNVQHLESLNDKIAAITEVSVAERIPDYLFDHATSVELIDIEPDELIERLEAGKVYVPERARTALHNFFSKKNLAALREISLRRMADRQIRNVDASDAATRPEAGEDVLVYITSDEGNVKAIRAAANMAGAYHGAFTALIVDSTASRRLEPDEQQQLQSNVALAEELGANAITLYGDDIAQQIAQYAATAGIAHVVIGSPALHSRGFRTANNLVSRLTQLSRGTEINVVPVKNLPRQVGRYVPATAYKMTAGDAWKALAAVAIAGALGLFIDFLGLSSSIILMGYMLVVLLFATRAEGFFYSILASLGSMLTYNFLFVEPRLSLDAYGLNSPFIFLFILLCTLVASSLTIRIRRQTQRAGRRAYRMEILLESNRKLQLATDAKECVQLTAAQIMKLMDQPIIMYQVDENGHILPPQVFRGEGTDDFSTIEYVSADEQAVAAWVAANNERAGATTDTLPDANCLYLPIHGKDQVFGVAGIVAREEDEEFEPFEKNLLLAILDECGQAIERTRLSEERQSMELRVEKEALRSNLLRMISHDLRTPLTSISGDADVLISQAGKLPTEKQESIYRDIQEDANWLISLVENLLSVTRIDDGTVQLDAQPELVGDVVEGALQHVSRRSEKYDIVVDIQDGLLMAEMDAQLIMQVVINLVNNAVNYTPEGSRVTIAASQVAGPEGKMVRISVADNGQGIPDEEKEHIFDMFYNGPARFGAKSGDSKRGLGLGLALCRSIVRVHGSEIYVRDVKPHGSEFFFSLPYVDASRFATFQERQG